MAQNNPSLLDSLVRETESTGTPVSERPFYLKVEHVSSKAKVQEAWKRAMTDSGVLSGKSAWNTLRKDLKANGFTEDILERTSEGYFRQTRWSRGNARVDVSYAVPLYTNGKGYLRKGLRVKLYKA